MSSMDRMPAVFKDLLNTVGNKTKTHGDPDLFASVFIDMLKAYIGGVHKSGRELQPADTHIILDFMKTARVSAGGLHAVHARDKVGYAGLAASMILQNEQDRLTREYVLSSQANTQASEANGQEYSPPANERELLKILDSRDPFSDILTGAEEDLLVNRRAKPGVTNEIIKARWEDFELRRAEQVKSAPIWTVSPGALGPMDGGSGAVGSLNLGGGSGANRVVPRPTRRFMDDDGRNALDKRPGAPTEGQEAGAEGEKPVAEPGQSGVSS